MSDDELKQALDNANRAIFDLTMLQTMVPRDDLPDFVRDLRAVAWKYRKARASEDLTPIDRWMPR